MNTEQLLYHVYDNESLVGPQRSNTTVKFPTVPCESLTPCRCAFPLFCCWPTSSLWRFERKGQVGVNRLTRRSLAFILSPLYSSWLSITKDGGELYRMFGHDWSSPPGKSGGKGDGVQLAVAFASVSFYYFSPGIFRWDLDLCKPAIHSDKLFFSAS